MIFYDNNKNEINENLYRKILEELQIHYLIIVEIYNQLPKTKLLY